MLKKYWYLLLFVFLLPVLGCALGSQVAPSPTTETEASTPTVIPSPTPCTGSAVGPRNLLVIRDCPTELSGTQQMMTVTVRVSNRSSRAVIITTDQGTFEVGAGADMDVANTARPVGWSLK